MKVSRNIQTQDFSTGFCAAQAVNVDSTRRLPSSVPPALFNTGKEWVRNARIFQLVKHDSFILQRLGTREGLLQVAQEAFIARGWILWAGFKCQPYTENFWFLWTRLQTKKSSPPNSERTLTSKLWQFQPLNPGSLPLSGLPPQFWGWGSRPGEELNCPCCMYSGGLRTLQPVLAQDKSKVNLSWVTIAMP